MIQTILIPPKPNKTANHKEYNGCISYKDTKWCWLLSTHDNNQHQKTHKCKSFSSLPL